MVRPGRSAAGGPGPADHRGPSSVPRVGGDLGQVGRATAIATAVPSSIVELCFDATARGKALVGLGGNGAVSAETVERSARGASPRPAQLRGYRAQVNEFVLGVLLLAVGALFALRGYLAMRVVIPVWGALAGFVLGAGLVSNLGSDRFLGSVASWLVGLAVAILFGLLAYLYYEVSVVLAMSAVGFAIGTSLMVAVGVTWSWLIVVVGVLAGVLLAVVAIVGNLPMVLLTVLTAMAGSSAIVAGVMMVAGTVTDADLNDVATTERLSDQWGWYLLYVVVAVAGIVAQLRDTERRAESLRSSWAEDGGRELRRTG